MYFDLQIKRQLPGTFVALSVNVEHYFIGSVPCRAVWSVDGDERRKGRREQEVW